MTKEKSLDTMKLPSGNHNFPRCMNQFRETFESMKEINLYVEEIYPGRFRKIRHNENVLEIKGYNDLTSSYKIDIKYEKFMQTFNLKVLPENKNNFENFLESCLSR